MLSAFRRLTCRVFLLLVAAAPLALLMATPSRAQGGPPLITDDPDTPGDGHWEINLGAVPQALPQVTYGDLLHVDLNYGLGDRIQLKAETGYIVAKEAHWYGAGMDDFVYGVKYRFYETGTEDEGIRISTYPQVETAPSFGNHHTPYTTTETVYYLPIEVKEGFGTWALSQEVGYEVGGMSGHGWAGGIAASLKVAEHAELLGELHDGTDMDFPIQGPMFQVGARIQQNDLLAWQFAIGRMASSAPIGLSTIGYLGVKLTF